MSLIPQECIEYDEARKICIAEQYGKKYTLNNDSGFKIQKIKVDGCLAQHTGEKRCDYLFKIETKTPQNAIFVELKGGDLITAVRQVSYTINYLRAELKTYDLLVRIIGSRDVPKLKISPAYRQLLQLIPPQNFKYATNGVYTEKI